MLADDPEQLRLAAGLSRAKVTYLRSLAEHVLDGSLDLAHLDDLPDEACGLVAAVPGGLPVFGEVGLERGVLLFSAAITIATGLLFGAMPAVHAARADLGESLRSRGSDGPIGRAVQCLILEERSR